MNSQKWWLAVACVATVAGCKKKEEPKPAETPKAVAVTEVVAPAVAPTPVDAAMDSAATPTQIGRAHV